MTEADVTENPEESAAETAHRRFRMRSVLRWVGYSFAAVLAVVLAFVAYLHTSPGRQFIVDQISSFAPASGLSIEVGSIDGSVLWSATFNDVKVRDANDTLFLEIPEVDLNWRPHKWFTSGLDVRHLVASGGTLYAFPELVPGDPDAPLLPDFDIRIDRFVIEDLTVAEGLLGAERIIQFRTEADIRDGRVYLDSDGAFGGGDEFALVVEAEPDGDVFDLDLSWQAPQGGFLAGMVGAQEDLAVTLKGEGSWTAWHGDLLAVQGETELLDFDIYNESGQYRLVGEIRPGDYLEGLPAQALGEVVALTASGTLLDSVLEGGLLVRGQAVEIDAEGTIDLADNAFEGLVLDASLLDSTLFGEGLALEGARARATLDGSFRDLRVLHEIRVDEIDAGGTIVSGLVQRGTATWDGTRAVLPLDVRVDRVISGNEMADPRLVNGLLEGTVVYTGSRILSDDLALRFPGLAARMNLDGNLDTGRFELAGPVRAADLTFDGIGTVDAGANIRFAIGGGAAWTLSAQLDGRVDRVTNSTLANLAGENIRFNGGISLGETRPIDFNNLRVTASKLQLQMNGRVQGDRTTVAGTGHHVDYGPFTVEASLDGAGPRAELVFADPYPTLGLTDVRVALAPSDDGFVIETSGGSLVGPFDGLVDLTIAANGDTTVGIARFDIAETRITGDLALLDGGVAGTLDLSRGGVDGTVELGVRDGGQAFDADIVARNARFGELSLARADIDASGFIGGGNSTIRGSMTGQGIGYGTFFIGRMAAEAEVVNGRGHFDAAISGRRGSRFELLLNGDVAPDRIAVAARGSYAGEDITMPRRAVLLSQPDGGWELQRTQIGYGGGFAVMSGRFGGEGPTEGRFALSDMPLSLADVALGDFGLGGTISGVIDFQSTPGGLPTGQARVRVDGLTRSSALLTSRPMDIAAVVQLSPTILQARAVMSDGGGANGRLDARIADLPQAGGLGERLYSGDLLARLRYDGPASALWRLAAIDLIDITGPLKVTAVARGSLGDPQVRGSLGGDDLRIQSSLTGTDITNVRARGSFAGSRLQLSSFAGNSPNGGRVSGSGFVDMAGMTAKRGPQIDLRMAARNARILNLPEMGATVTGPLRIVSNGVGGTVAGRLQIDGANWRLGTSEVLQELPDIEITEINLPADIAPVAREGQPWRYLINASADGGIEVDGMGLDSEWRGDIRLRGTTADPRVGGEVRIVPRQGFYSFAGTRFDITRGRIDFDESAPIDPRVDILAETEVQSASISVAVQGFASQPEITFSSVPALPEEEVLARLLFGGSITDLSATDAIQLASALASLRGGGGMDPINKLRTAIGLDRLRIVPADQALNRGTSVALGKSISDRFYAEVVTDGQGYNATELEFRVTSWLSLLATINTLGRYGAAAEYSKDY